MESWRDNCCIQPTDPVVPTRTDVQVPPLFPVWGADSSPQAALKQGQEEALGTAFCNSQVLGVIEGLSSVTLFGAFPTVKRQARGSQGASLLSEETADNII